MKKNCCNINLHMRRKGPTITQAPKLASMLPSPPLATTNTCISQWQTQPLNRSLMMPYKGKCALQKPIVDDPPMALSTLNVIILLVKPSFIMLLPTSILFCALHRGWCFALPIWSNLAIFTLIVLNSKFKMSSNLYL